jgi:myo-inositol-1(or 4)-monophosphatase
VTELDVAVEAALAAGRILAERAPTGVRHKGTVDLVTEVDLACERAIREVLAHHTPDIPVLGEEGGGAEAATTRWVVDPLDGTTNFVHGFPYYCVSVALEVDGRGRVGVGHDPVRGRTYRAARGEGAFVDGVPLRVSETATLGEALLATGFPYDRRDRLDVLLAAVRAALSAGQGLRRAGAAALDLAMVSAGCIDGYWELNLGRWDAAAGLVLVEEAGGRVSAVPGHALGDRPCPVATNGRIHDALLELLAAT